jgi:Flp pilus assembly protein TadD
MKIEGYYKPAIDVLDLAIRLKPNDAICHIERGQIYGLLHDKDSGVQDEMQALALASSNSPEDIEYRSLAHENLAGIYLNNKEPLKAEAELKVSLQLCPDSPLTAERLATLLINNKNTKEGLFYLATAKNSYEKLGQMPDMQRVNLKILDLQKKPADLNRNIISYKIVSYK